MYLFLITNVTYCKRNNIILLIFLYFIGIYFLLLLLLLQSMTLLENKIYGSVTVNAKWQIVIPAEARASLDIKPWDQLIVTTKWWFVVGLIKADNMQEFLMAIEQEHPECFRHME